MKFNKRDLFLTPLSFFLVLILSILSTIIISYLVKKFYISEVFHFFLILIAFYGSIVGWTLVLLKALRMIFPLKKGILSMDDDSLSVRIWKLQGFLYIFNLGLLYNSSFIPINLRGFFYSLLGTKIGKSVMIGGKILEPAMVSIGSYTHIGEDAIVSGHGVAGKYVTINDVIIGNAVTVGAGAIISPGAMIGDGSVIAMGAVVSGKTTIPEFEIWGGVPAIKIGEVKKWK